MEQHTSAESFKHTKHRPCSQFNAHVTSDTQILVSCSARVADSGACNEFRNPRDSFCISRLGYPARDRSTTYTTREHCVLCFQGNLLGQWDSELPCRTHLATILSSSGRDTIIHIDPYGLNQDKYNRRVFRCLLC